MGSRIITKDKAAAVLDVSPRTIYRYMQRGLLTAHFDGRKSGVLEEEVLLLKRNRQAESPTVIDKEMVLKLQVELQTLKSQMAAVMRILNIKHDELNFTDTEYRHLYRRAEECSISGWSPHEEDQWADIFVRIRIDDLTCIERAVDDAHPWRVLLRLATTMHLNSYRKDLRDILAAGRNNLHQVAGMWCTLKGETPKTFDLLVQRDAAPLKKLLRKLQKSQEG